MTQKWNMKHEKHNNSISNTEIRNNDKNNNDNQ